MTRKSKRELARAIDDLGGDGDMIQEWANRYFERTIKQGFDVDFSTRSLTLQNPAVVAAPEEEETIPILDVGNGFILFAPRSDVPGWVDLEDLPVDHDP